MAKKLGGLGKGLNAIFIENDSEDNNGSVMLKISEIEPNRSQPRKEFDERHSVNLQRASQNTDFFNRCLSDLLQWEVIR